MNIGLRQVDGKWSNIALMKISTYHKMRGDKVSWYNRFWKFDIVYSSKIFMFTSDDVTLPENAIRGGTGYPNPEVALPDEIEACRQDYSLYPKNDYSIGFTSRGCIRNCDFCLVPKKEGKLKIVGDIYNFWDKQNKIVLLDNNLTACPIEHFRKICFQIKKENIAVDFSSGLDLRLLRKDHVIALNGLKLAKSIHFAWDNINDEKKIRKGIKTYWDNIEKKSLKPVVYVLIGYNTTVEEDLHRVETLRGLKFEPYVMPYNRKILYQRKFARWVNHKGIFHSVKWVDYRGRKAR
jgi:hypothetical protein